MSVYKYLSFTLLLCILAIVAFGQKQIKRYVQEQAVQVMTIEPDSSIYTDLEPLGNAIGNARIVMLGEQDHGDAPGYLAKTRLIKYLHENKGFNVVAFEDDFFNINYNWALVRAGSLHIHEFIKRNISNTWATCGALSPFFQEYLPGTLKTDHPLLISAFDNMMAIPQTLTRLDSVWRNLEIPIVKTPEYASEILPLLSNSYKYTNDTLTTDKIIKYYEEIKTQMLVKLLKEDFWIMTIDNVIQQNWQFRNWKKNIWNDRNTRDRQMAVNLKWIAEVKYPNEKIIVWAHNWHVSKYSGHYQNKVLNSGSSMGSVFTQDSTWMNTTYVVGFTSAEGTAGRTFEKKYKVLRPKQNGFENWMNKEYKYAFVDFKEYNRLYPSGDEEFYMKCSPTSPFHRNEIGQWNNIFDGVFYIKHTYHCER